MTFYRRLRTCWQLLFHPQHVEWWALWESHLAEERIALGEENIMLWKDNDYLVKTIGYYLDKLEEIMGDYYCEHQELEQLRAKKTFSLSMSLSKAQ